MPWWAIIYLVLFAAVTLSGAVLCLREEGPSFGGVCDLLAPVVFGYLFTAFWLPHLRSLLGHVAPVLFVAAVTWEVYSWPSDRRKTNADFELKIGRASCRER